MLFFLLVTFQNWWRLAHSRVQHTSITCGNKIRIREKEGERKLSCKFTHAKYYYIQKIHSMYDWMCVNVWKNSRFRFFNEIHKTNTQRIWGAITQSSHTPREKEKNVLFFQTGASQRRKKKALKTIEKQFCIDEPMPKIHIIIKAIKTTIEWLIH